MRAHPYIGQELMKHRHQNQTNIHGSQLMIGVVLIQLYLLLGMIQKLLSIKMVLSATLFLH